MSKTNLNDIGDVRAATSIINNNNALIENAIENTLSRDGTGPNEMNAQLDMNDHRVINLPAPVSDSEPMRKQDIDELIAAASSGIIATQAEAEAGVNNFKVMTPLRTLQSIDVNTQDAPIDGLGSAASRSVQDRLNDFVDVRSYGVSASNTASQNAVALQQAINSETKLFVGEKIRLNQPLVLTNRLLHITGYDHETSGLIFENCHGFQIDVSGSTVVRRPTIIEYLSIESTSINLYDGIDYTGKTGSQYGEQLMLSDCRLCGNDDSAGSRWKRNIVLDIAGQSHITRCTITGAGTSNRSDVGIYMERTKILHVDKNVFFNLDDAVQATNDTEGVRFISNDVLSCVNGVVSFNNVGNQFNIEGNHFAVAVSAVVLAANRTGGSNTGSNASFIVNNFPLVFDGLPDHASDDFIGFDIGSNQVKIIGNEILRTSAVKTRIGVRLRSVGSRVVNDAIIIGNCFTAMNKGVILDAGTLTCTLGPNRGINTRTNMYEDNSGSGSNRFFFADAAGIAQQAPLHEFVSRDGIMARVTHTTTGTAIANYLTLYSGIASATPRIQSEGTDTNIDLRLLPKGTGAVRFGTHTANADAPIVGYITVKDDAGTLRKLAVIA